MTLEKYIVTVRHDNGLKKLKVKTFGGEATARHLIINKENCPTGAIIKVKKQNSKK